MLLLVDKTWMICSIFHFPIVIFQIWGSRFMLLRTAESGYFSIIRNRDFDNCTRSINTCFWPANSLDTWNALTVRGVTFFTHKLTWANTSLAFLIKPMGVKADVAEIGDLLTLQRSVFSYYKAIPYQANYFTYTTTLYLLQTSAVSGKSMVPLLLN